MTEETELRIELINKFKKWKKEFLEIRKQRDYHRKMFQKFSREARIKEKEVLHLIDTLELPSQEKNKKNG